MAALFIPILNLIIILDINNFVEIKKVEIYGNSFFSEGYLLRDYKPFKNFYDIEKFIKKILFYYNNAGFPFCKVYPEFRELDKGKELMLKIDEGERVIIKDYLFRTDGKTNIQSLRRIARVKKNRFFSLNNLNITKNEILKTNTFIEVKENILKEKENYYLYFEIKEKSSDYLLGGGSFSQKNSQLSFEFSSLNVLGTLRRLQVCYEMGISESKKKNVVVNFLEPVLLNPVTFNTQFQILSYDSAHLSKFYINFNAPVNNHLNVMLLSGFELTNYLSVYGIYSNTRTILGTGLDFYLSTGDYEISNSIKSDYLIRDAERVRIFFDGTVRWGHLFIKPHYRRVITDSFEYFDYIRIGGAGSLRGYMEEEFILKQTLWFNLEYKRLPIYPLVDIGWIKDECIYSYGFGIDARTSSLNSSIAFAIPKNGKWYDAKIHILLEKNL
uniref:POTRA domain-containing protein n=1 Tax=candidate division WOR-3 bacterium TaxID=2052148 RepID=A0A7V3RIX7_UNCW3